MLQHLKKRLRMTTALLLSAICAISTGCGLPAASQTVTPVSVSGYKLNTYVTIKAYSSTTQEVMQGCLDLCDTYENMFSMTLPESTLYQVNHQQIHTIPAEMASLIQTGLSYSLVSGGSFALTIGSVSQLWDFTSDSPSVPDAAAISRELVFVDDSKVQLSPVDSNDPNGDWNISIPDGAMIDLGAVAKGYIADKIKDYLLSQGVTRAVIDLGGNILCVGSKSDTSAFAIGVRKPFGGESDYLVSLNIKDMSVVSSGTYERCFTDADGNFYYHILDPHTGYPYETNLTQVTIISPYSTDGDCLSTVCFTLGLDGGMELIESLPGIEAIFVTDDGTLHYSSGVAAYLKK